MKSDIFSYGLVLHYMVTGDKPWAAEESHVAGAERMNEALPDYPENFGKGPLNDLYDSCLCWEPEQRPSAGEIINKKFQGKNT
jgi:serine/threonine protein kinase